MKALLHSLVLAAATTATVLPMQSALAKDEGDWMVRLRGIAVTPDESGTISTIGGSPTVGDEYTLELDFSYFFTENWAAELILATTKHDIGATGTSLGTLDLGSVWLLPPTLNFQYHFMPKEKFSPYLGAGINLTLFHSVNNGPVAVDVDYDTAFGFSLQAGADLMLTEGTYLNFDVKKLFLDTDVTVDAGALGTVTTNANLNPWIFGIGIGRSF